MICLGVHQNQRDDLALEDLIELSECMLALESLSSKSLSGFNHALITSLNSDFDQQLSTSWLRELFIKRSACWSQPVRSCVRGLTWPTSWPSPMAHSLIFVNYSFLCLRYHKFLEHSPDSPRSRIVQTIELPISCGETGKKKTNQRTKYSLFLF